MFKYNPECFILTYTVIIVNISIQVCSQQIRNAKSQPGNVEDILKMLYKNKEQSKDKDGNEYEYVTAQRYGVSRRNENMVNTQKAALRDVLMMKLVSYYEDKYKLSHRDTVPTENIRQRDNDIFDDKPNNYHDLQITEDNRKRSKAIMKQIEYNPVAEVLTI